MLLNSLPFARQPLKTEGSSPNVSRLRLKNPERWQSANRALDRPEHGAGSKNTRHPNKHACAYARVYVNMVIRNMHRSSYVQEYPRKIKT